MNTPSKLRNEDRALCMLSIHSVGAVGTAVATTLLIVLSVVAAVLTAVVTPVVTAAATAVSAHVKPRPISNQYDKDT